VRQKFENRFFPFGPVRKKKASAQDKPLSFFFFFDSFREKINFLFRVHRFDGRPFGVVSFLYVCSSTSLSGGGAVRRRR
jgi:hypothetical protein